MIVDVTETLLAEAQRFRLRLACEDCAHFEPNGLDCSLGFPNASHVRDAPRRDRVVVFCKAFELA